MYIFFYEHLLCAFIHLARTKQREKGGEVCPFSRLRTYKDLVFLCVDKFLSITWLLD